MTEQPDPHVQEAIAEERQRLDEAMQQYQVQYLMSRAISLNADARAARAAAEGKVTEGEESDTHS